MPLCFHLALAVAGVLGLAGQACADGGMLKVFMNQARILRLDRPVSKVIVGNDKIADVTVADARTIVLTGRSFGTTNIVLLDHDGQAILDDRVLVSLDEQNTLLFFKQTDRSVYSCTPECEKRTQLGNSAAGSSTTSSSSQLSTQ
ncbi:pilus assembly protein N-terminal domain-containing protein [Allorhizobium sp. BGMRC 0089]|nr:pilus assembly protein N-terminal domain-containing protein [Allorhizobium sonneratiae]MCM2291783.1 pilus assembly protein N-terminal domain-containing protein [Allorhizobium sonneratiae]